MDREVIVMDYLDEYQTRRNMKAKNTKRNPLWEIATVAVDGEEKTIWYPMSSENENYRVFLI